MMLASTGTRQLLDRDPGTRLFGAPGDLDGSPIGGPENSSPTPSLTRSAANRRYGGRSSLREYRRRRSRHRHRPLQRRRLRRGLPASCGSGLRPRAPDVVGACPRRGTVAGDLPEALGAPRPLRPGARFVAIVPLDGRARALRRSHPLRLPASRSRGAHIRTSSSKRVSSMHFHSKLECWPELCAGTRSSTRLRIGSSRHSTNCQES